MENFDLRLRNLVLSCFIVPLFIGDENKGRNTIELLGQDSEKDKLEISRCEPTQQKILLPVDRQRSNFRTLGKEVDRTVDRSSQPESENSLSVDRAVDRTQQRAMLLQTVDCPVDRSAQLHFCACRSTKNGPKTQSGYLCKANLFPMKILLIYKYKIEF